MAMFFRAELAQPGLQFVDSQTFNGLVSVHATLMIFLFIIPAFAGLANFACRSCSARRTWRSRA
jgi:cytochrome c oxidase subunit 1